MVAFSILLIVIIVLFCPCCVRKWNCLNVSQVTRGHSSDFVFQGKLPTWCVCVYVCGGEEVEGVGGTRMW